MADRPRWVQSIVEWLLSNEAQLEPFDKMQIVFNRTGDTVSADWGVKSIRLPQPR